MGNFAITRREDGTLEVPSRAEGENVIGDGTRIIPPEHPEYGKFFEHWERDLELTERHGKHEDQAGVEGQQGGSAPGFTHSGAKGKDGRSREVLARVADVKINSLFTKYAKSASAQALMLEAWDRANEYDDLREGIEEEFLPELGNKIIKILDEVPDEPTDAVAVREDFRDYQWKHAQGNRWANESFADSHDFASEESKQAIVHYKTVGFRDINNHLRGESLTDMTEDEAQENVNAIDDLLKESVIDQDVVLYRAMDVEDKDLEGMVGESVTFDSYTSTSMRPLAIKDFLESSEEAGEEPVMVEILTPKGTHAFYPDLRTLRRRFHIEFDEGEIVLDRGMQFNVIGAREDRDPRGEGTLKFITLEVIPGSGVNYDNGK